jgi:purine-cytosine permease-like protein
VEEAWSPAPAAALKGQRRIMRWKLLLIASLVATIIGAGLPLGIVLGFSGSTDHMVEPNVLVLSTLLIPVATITGATLFVYRHTARRRRLQAALTVLLSTTLTLAILLFGSVLLSKPGPATDPPPRRNVG